MILVPLAADLFMLDRRCSFECVLRTQCKPIDDHDYLELMKV